MNTREHLIFEIDAFLERTGMLPTTFGVLAAGERNFVQRLKDGKSCTLDKYDRVRNFMKNYARSKQNSKQRGVDSST